MKIFLNKFQLIFLFTALELIFMYKKDFIELLNSYKKGYKKWSNKRLVKALLEELNFLINLQ